MKYTIEQLALAAQVRDLAAAMRTGAKPRADAGQWKSAEHLAAMEQWDLENPMSKFVEKALAEIQETADVIMSRLKPSA